MSAMLVRLLLAVGISAGLVGVWRLASAFVLWRSGRSASRLGEFARGTPGVVFFTTADCVTCKAAQRPALAALRARMGEAVQVIEVDAQDNVALARDWSVLSVPTTFILDRDGRPRQVNHGFASADKLAAQIASVA